MPAAVQMPIYEDELKRTMQERFNRIEGQVRGLSRMVEQQRPCMELLQQIASVQAALKGVSKVVLRNYLERCATDAIRSQDTDIYDELMDVIYKFVR